MFKCDQIALKKTSAKVSAIRIQSLDEKTFRDLGSGFVVKICVMKKDDE